MKNNNEVVFKKIPLSEFIDMLNEAWDNGAHYIDIVGVPDQVQDNIAIVAYKEYVNPENEFEMDVELEHPNEKKDLSDEDLNQLI